MKLLVAAFFTFVFILVALGYLLRPAAKRQIMRAVEKELEKRNLLLINMVIPAFPDTGPFKNSYSPYLINTTAYIMGCYPDFKAYRKLTVKDYKGRQFILWMKLQLDPAGPREAEWVEEMPE